MSNEWEDWAKDEGAALSFTKPFDLNYEYKVMRRKVKTEREEFVEMGIKITCEPNMAYCLQEMYDAGARFKPESGKHCIVCGYKSTIPHSDFCDKLSCSGRLK